MMRFERTYVFLIRFSIVLILFLCIALIVNSLVDNQTHVAYNSDSFLAVPDKSVDSVIQLLSLEEKVNLVFMTDNFDSTYLRTPQTNQSEINHTADTIFLNDTSNYNNMKKIVPKIKKFIFVGTGEQVVLNSITDSSWVAEYLLSRSRNFDSSFCSIVNLRFEPIDYQSFNDSAFGDFYTRRWLYLKQSFQKHAKLLGLNINFNKIAEFGGIRNSSVSSEKIFSFFRENTDVLIIDSFSTRGSESLSFNGLLVAKLSDKEQNMDLDILSLFNKKMDIFLVDSSIAEIYKNKLIDLVKTNKLSENELNIKIRKIVKAALWMDMGKLSPEFNDVKIHSTEFYELINSQKSLVLLNNPDSLLPVQKINDRKFALIWIGQSVNKYFKENLGNYVQFNTIQLMNGKADWKKKIGNLAKTSFCICVLDTLLKDSIDIKQFNELLVQLNPKSTAILNFSNFANLKFLPLKFPVVQIQSRKTSDFAFSAQAVFGGIPVEGQLPVSYGLYSFGQKKESPKTRLKFSIPEEVGLDPQKLNEIDRIANSAISNGAFPGCQVFVAKNGQVVYNKCFGYHTYANNEPVKENDVYDLASVTKISATTIAAMKMISDRKMTLNDLLGKFFKNTKIDYTRIKPDTLINIDTFYKSTIKNWNKFLKDKDTTNISDTSFAVIDTVIYRLTPRLNIFKVPLVDLLRHQSGIAPALPIFRYMYYKAYYVKKMKEYLTAMHGRTGPLFDYKTFELPEAFPENTKLADSLKARINQGFKSQYDEYFTKKYVKDSSDIKLTNNLYLRNKYFDTIWRDTKQLPVYGRKVFIYSDINMILMQMAIDSLNHSSIDEYMKKTIYNTLGLRSITYHPLDYFPPGQIIPTEQENVFRYGYLHGYVHDPSAALLGGMAGNAGLFASAHDLGILFQMILNKGAYGGIKYIEPSVIEQFTTRIDETQRGLGFDMPNRKAKVGNKAPQTTFGHSGYTGTCVWVDPENEIVYVFLANRNHPNENNWRINSQNIRERIHNAIYDAMVDKKKESPDEKPIVP